MKNLMKKVFWWGLITHRGKREFFGSFNIKLLFYIILYIFLVALFIMAFFNTSSSKQEINIPVTIIFIIADLFFFTLIFLFFLPYYLPMISYRTDKIQKLIPEYEPLNKDLLKDAIKSALELEGVQDDEFAQVVRGLFLQELKRKNDFMDLERRTINRLKAYVGKENA